MKFQPIRSILRCAILMLLASSPLAYADSSQDNVQFQEYGLGKLANAPKPTVFGSLAAQPPDAPLRTPMMLRQALPSNQWYSAVMFKKWAEPIHAHPATYQATANGLEIDYPHQSVIAAAGRNDIAFGHHAALILEPVGFKVLDAKLDAIGDFSARLEMGDGQGHALHATLLHGSPLSYYELDVGDLRVHLGEGSTPCAAELEHTLCVKVAQRTYAVFAPNDAHWSNIGSADPTIQFGASGRFLSVALLPDDGVATLNNFAQHAFAFVTGSHVNWRYDQQHSKVITQFAVDIKSMQQDQKTALLGLYTHQARALAQPVTPLFYYESVRGAIAVIDANRFETAYDYHGIVPFWSGLQDAGDRNKLASIMEGDAARARGLYSSQLGNGTYWYGKALAANAQLMCVAEQEGDIAMRDTLLQSLKQHLEAWFKGDAPNGYFVKNARTGTVVGYPEEYGSISHLNDHHFHYGYWINAAAHVALRDPVWAQQSHWGAMVDQLIGDIATPERGRADFPFIRNFDVYEGHSWASGDADFVDGNNQESSSEAVNAWAGLILWGEATKNKAVRDLGIWLYTTETEAISDYWFDQRHAVFSKEYGKVVAAQVFGGRYAYNTWWTEEPRQIQGINLMPITPASIYLGRDPAYIIQFMNAIGPEKRAYLKRGKDDGTPSDIWQDILMSYYALAEPEPALEHWKPKGSVELGETRSHTLYWLLSLKEMGRPDFTISADTALYSVFRTANGALTHLAYNADDTPITVHFSDGVTVPVGAHTLARK